MKHGGSTPGWEAMIIVNGPIREQLGFDDGQGAQRPGNQANTSIGRFYRLFARNVPRFLPGSTDMATFGQMFRAVLAENERACAEMGWRPLHVTRGFEPDDSVVTITSVQDGERSVHDRGRNGGAAPRLHRRLGQANDRALSELARLRRNARAAAHAGHRVAAREGGVFEARTWQSYLKKTRRGAGALLRMEHDAGRPSHARYDARRPGREGRAAEGVASFRRPRSPGSAAAAGVPSG